jgi:hypothetical protein
MNEWKKKRGGVRGGGEVRGELYPARVRVM